MTSRRSALSYLTGGAVAAGALVAAGGLMRSCAPVETRTTRVDLSDMTNSEIRAFTSTDERYFVARTDDTLTILGAQCPVDPPFGWIMLDFDDVFYCPRCTSRFDRTGQIVQFWSNRSPPDHAPNLTRGNFQTDGLTLLVAENQTLPIFAERTQ